MPRKSKHVVKEFEELQNKLQEVERLKELAEQQDKELMENTRKEIDSICEKTEFFCGIILTQQDVLQIVKLAMETKENIKIPFQLYFKD